MARKKKDRTPAEMVEAMRDLLLEHRPQARPEEFAEWILNRNERTVRRWISGESPVPREAREAAAITLAAPTGWREMVRTYDYRVKERRARLAAPRARGERGRMPVAAGGTDGSR